MLSEMSTCHTQQGKRMFKFAEKICVVAALALMVIAFTFEFKPESNLRMKLFALGFGLMLLSEVFERL